MKKINILLAGVLAAIAVPSAASAAPFGQPYGAPAQSWQSINGRQATLEMRIHQGVRSGALTMREAMQLRGEFRGLASLEARYRASRPGLTMGERADLERRFDALSAKIRIDKHDGDRRGHGRRW